MANGKTKRKKEKRGNSVAKKDVGRNCKRPLWDSDKKQTKKRGVSWVNPGVFGRPSRRIYGNKERREHVW